MKSGGGKGGRIDSFRLVKGEWGDPKTIPQKGIVTYGVAANRLDPLAGIWRAAIFNTARRVFGQVLFVAPPFLVAYGLMNWANERNEFLNSKAGRVEEE